MIIFQANDEDDDDDDDEDNKKTTQLRISAMLLLLGRLWPVEYAKQSETYYHCSWNELTIDLIGVLAKCNAFWSVGVPEEFNVL